MSLSIEARINDAKARMRAAKASRDYALQTAIQKEFSALAWEKAGLPDNLVFHPATIAAFNNR